MADIHDSFLRTSAGTFDTEREVRPLVQDVAR